MPVGQSDLEVTLRKHQRTEGAADGERQDEAHRPRGQSPVEVLERDVVRLEFTSVGC